MSGRKETWHWFWESWADGKCSAVGPLCPLQGEGRDDCFSLTPASLREWNWPEEKLAEDLNIPQFL